MAAEDGLALLCIDTICRAFRWTGSEIPVSKWPYASGAAIVAAGCSISLVAIGSLTACSLHDSIVMVRAPAANGCCPVAFLSQPLPLRLAGDLRL